jgi:hypothetical protein
MIDITTIQKVDQPSIDTAVDIQLIGIFIESDRENFVESCLESTRLSELHRFYPYPSFRNLVLAVVYGDLNDPWVGI